MLGFSGFMDAYTGVRNAGRRNEGYDTPQASNNVPLGGNVEQPVEPIAEQPVEPIAEAATGNAPIGSGGNVLRNMARDFDPESNESVLALQRQMNQSGYDLKEDGIFGEKTEGVLRQIQGQGNSPMDAYQQGGSFL